MDLREIVERVGQMNKDLAVRLMELSSWLPWVSFCLLLGAGHLILVHLLCLSLPLRLAKRHFE